VGKKCVFINSQYVTDLQLVAEFMVAVQEAFELVVKLVSGAVAVPVPTCARYEKRTEHGRYDDGC